MKVAVVPLPDHWKWDCWTCPFGCTDLDGELFCMIDNPNGCPVVVKKAEVEEELTEKLRKMKEGELEDHAQYR